jgi:argininosuccinate lyase
MKKSSKSSHDKTPYKLWGGRFEKGPSRILEAFSKSLAYDYRLLWGDIQGTKAYAGALHRAGILSNAEAARAVRALDALAREVAAAGDDYFRSAPEEDIHTFVLGKLRASIGSLAEKLHTGRSRNEQVALDFRLWMKQNILLTQGALGELLAALIAAAEKNSSTILPGYTHLRRAQPVLWAHYCLAYFEMFRRDFERLGAAYQTADVMPLGSGALAGSGLAMDRRRAAKELGFAKISRNSLDAASDRDFALEYLFAASVSFAHLTRLAEDFILYSSEEFGFLELADEVTTGSSLMPQKKNPDSMELIRGKSGRVFGHLISLLTTIKGLPLAYNRDLQEDKEPVFDTADQWQMALRLAAQVVATAKLDRDRMRQAASDGWLCATDLAEFLAFQGVPFHQAHEIVGKLVLESVRAGRQPCDCTLDDLRRHSPRFDPQALKLLTPESGVARRAVPGGTAPASVRSALREARAWLRSTSRKAAVE